MNGWSNRVGSEQARFRQEVITSLDLDIYCICETHLREPGVLEVGGYTWFGNNRTRLARNAPHGSGGVGVLIKNSILAHFSVLILDKTVEGILWLKLSLKEVSDVKLLLCVVYLPPANSSRGDSAQQCYDALTSQIYTYYSDESELIICGDFNGRIGDLQDWNTDDSTLPPRKAIDSTHNVFGECLVDFLRDLGLCVVNGRVTPTDDNYTCVSNRGRSVVDYFITPVSAINKFVRCSTSLITDISEQFDLVPPSRNFPDHSLLSCEFALSEFKAALNINNEETSSEGSRVDNKTRRIYDVNNIPPDMFDNEEYNDPLLSVISKLQEKHDDPTIINNAYSDIIDAIHNAMDNTLDYKDYKMRKSAPHNHRVSRPYWNNHLRTLWSNAARAERAFVKYKGLKAEKNELRLLFYKKRKLFDQDLRRAERQWHATQRTKLCMLKRQNPKEFWNQLNSLLPGKKKLSIDCVKLKDNTISTATVDIINGFRDAFSKVYNAPDQLSSEMQNSIILLENSPSPFDDSNLNAEISLEETKDTILSLKKGKSVGPDKLPNEILKCEQIQQLLHSLFYFCFENGVIPDLWKESIVLPVLKKGRDAKVPVNYRGISLTSTVAKVYNSILNARITKFLDTNNLISDEQNGFRKGRSCLDHLYSLTTVLRNRINDNLSTYCCFVDCTKAFDKINHKYLLYKLLSNGIKGKAYKTIKNSYSMLSSKLKINHHFTEPIDVNSGVRQGDTLSPTLFSIYVNDLVPLINALEVGVPLSNRELSLLLYADDIVLVSASLYGLQSQLNVLSEWMNTWQLGANLDKTKIIHFKPTKTNRTLARFYLEGSLIEKTDSYTYLGILLTEHLDFKRTADQLSKGGGRASSKVISIHFQSKGLPWNILTHVYESVVCPVTDYASGIWGLKRHGCCDKVQRRIIRCFLGLPKTSPVPALEGDMGWLPPYVRHQLEAVRLWCRLCLLPTNRLTRQIFDWDCIHALQNKPSWANKVGELLDICGHSDLKSRRLLTVPVKDVLRSVKIILTKKFEEKWFADIQSMPKLRTYQTLKSDFCTETYVKVLPPSTRSVIAQMRCGVFPLSLETGRWRGVALENRLCRACSMDEVETELHFLVSCPLYHELRKKFIFSDAPVNFSLLSDADKLSFLLNESFSNTALFIKEAYVMRNN